MALPSSKHYLVMQSKTPRAYEAAAAHPFVRFKWWGDVFTANCNDSKQQSHSYIQFEHDPSSEDRQIWTLTMASGAHEVSRAEGTTGTTWPGLRLHHAQALYVNQTIAKFRAGQHA